MYVPIQIVIQNLSSTSYHFSIRILTRVIINLMEQNDKDFSLLRRSLPKPLDQGFGSQIEVGVEHLSGDEAIEKSMSAETMHSSLFARTQKAGLFLSAVIVMKSMVGVGILGLPNVAKNFGVLPTIVLLLFVHVCTNFSTDLLIRCKNFSRHSNYTTIGYYILPSRLVIVGINLIIMFCNLGTCLSELMYVSISEQSLFATTCENLVSVYDDRVELPFYFQRWFYLILVGIVLIPLVTVKTIERLRFVSLIAILSVATFTSILIYNFIKQLANGSLASDWGLFPVNFQLKNAFASIPNAVLAYNWHFNQFPVYKGMIDPCDKRLRSASRIGTMMGSGLYLTVSLLGYMTYGSKVQTNFLKTISMEQIGKPLYIFLNIAFTFSTTLTLPLIFFGSRNNTISVFNEVTEQTKLGLSRKVKLFDTEMTVNEVRAEKAQRRRHKSIKFYGISLFVLVILVVLAIFVTQLGTVFNLIGAIGANVISTGLPGLFYFSLVKKLKVWSTLTLTQRRIYYLSKVFFAWSILLMIVCVGSEILKMHVGSAD